MRNHNNSKNDIDFKDIQICFLACRYPVQDIWIYILYE
jgi:hypothetical protein